ncbi:CLUMA_CG007858, isoform A [Clunio marinus]|uniref:CLUMA_CG007858, isoform A n=1 Tax=Clunio marinus TaxID=568069 RepID=A0A1J1I1X4_9DIPT|nr:CLUMA_CG007858, isoform A [Clunio marinus]
MERRWRGYERFHCDFARSLSAPKKERKNEKIHSRTYIDDLMKWHFNDSQQSKTREIKSLEYSLNSISRSLKSSVSKSPSDSVPES